MDTQLEDYPIVLQQDVIWGDMDAFGHVNNTVYFRYFEDARLAYFDRIGVNAYKEEFNIGPILATTRADFRLPLAYPDRIHIAGRASLLGPKKFSMQYRVYSEKFAAVAAEGEGLLVYYDYANGRSCEIPDRLLSAMARLNRSD